jgi:Zn finger protein HypA/HybF involved in hydrogenase expression
MYTTKCLACKHRWEDHLPEMPCPKCLSREVKDLTPKTKTPLGKEGVIVLE